LCPIFYPIGHPKTLPEREYETLFFRRRSEKGDFSKKWMDAGTGPFPALFETPEQKRQKG
jgi:hypothetical protein